MMHNFDPQSGVIRILSLAVFASLVFSSSILMAQDAPTQKLFLLPTQSVNDSTSSIIPERIGEQTRRAVQQDSKVALMPRFEVIRANLGAVGQSSAAVAEAEQLYTSGIGLLAAGDPERAAETFQRAVDMMESNIADISNFDVLADALSNLALAYFEAGFDLDARKSIKQFAHLSPDATLDPEKYDAELIEVYQDEVKKVEGGGPGKLNIEASVEGATVFIDGVEKGTTPMMVDDVGFGHHYLVVRSPTGSAVSAEKIRVRGRDKEQDFKIELGESTGEELADEADTLPTFYRELRDQVATGRFGEDLKPYLSELVTQTGADYVVWILMYKEGVTYRAAPFAYRASDEVIVQGDGTNFDIELSNLRAGISELSKTVVGLVVDFPEDSAVMAVEIGPAPAAPVVAKAEPEPDENTTAAASVTPPPSAADASVNAKAPPPSDSNTWTYVAAGGAVLVVGALIAGTVFLLSDDGNPDQAGGFSTSVSW